MLLVSVFLCCAFWQQAIAAHSVADSDLIRKILVRVEAAEDKIAEQDGQIAELVTEIKELKEAFKNADCKVYHNEIPRNQPSKRQVKLSSSILPHVKNSMSGSGSSVSPSGSVYTRWGRTKCEGGSTLLYSGFVGGSYWSSAGGSSNFECMPPNPEYNKFSTSGTVSIMSGAEYSVNLDVFSDKTNDHNVPCARCYALRSARMMIPAKRTCPQDWSREYEGYLMTSLHQHSSHYICVDANPEFIIGQQANTQGALLYFVKPDCDGEGTIGHCPPYEINKQLTCVVCTK